MKILVVADLHSQKKILEPLRATTENLQPDAVFCLGDLTIEGPSAAPYTISFLDAVESTVRPVYYVSGNNDDPETLEIMKQKGHSLDFAIKNLAQYSIVGIGYEPPIEPFIPELRESILLTHVPPKSGNVPSYIDNIPRFHFAGHLHSIARTWSMGKTTVVQVPTAMDLRAATFSLPEGRVEFIKLKP